MCNVCHLSRTFSAKLHGKVWLLAVSFSMWRIFKGSLYMYRIPAASTEEASKYYCWFIGSGLQSNLGLNVGKRRMFLNQMHFPFLCSRRAEVTQCDVQSQERVCSCKLCGCRRDRHKQNQHLSSSWLSCCLATLPRERERERGRLICPPFVFKD